MTVVVRWSGGQFLVARQVNVVYVSGVCMYFGNSGMGLGVCSATRCILDCCVGVEANQWLNC